MKNQDKENQEKKGQCKESLKFVSDYQMFAQNHRTSVTPLAVLYDNDMSDSAKVLFIVISGLCYKKGFSWVTNQGLCDRLHWGLTKVNKYIKELKDRKLITVEPFKRNLMNRRKTFINFPELMNYEFDKIKAV